MALFCTPQLPPTLCHNPRRRIIERFKRALFAPQSTSGNLKNELKKVRNAYKFVCLEISGLLYDVKVSDLNLYPDVFVIHVHRLLGAWNNH